MEYTYEVVSKYLLVFVLVSFGCLLLDQCFFGNWKNSQLKGFIKSAGVVSIGYGFIYLMA